MSWLNTFSFVMRANINTLRDKISDPERMLYQLLADMEQELSHVRESVASAIADEIRMEKRATRTREEVTTWSDRATSALSRKDEVDAKLALEQKLLAEQRAESLEGELDRQKQQTAKLRGSVQDLQDKIRQARQKQTLLLARLARAESTTRINQALDRAGSTSAFSEFNRLEERVDRAEAMSEAYDRLEGKDPAADELASKFEEADRKDRLHREFEELKRRVADNA